VLLLFVLHSSDSPFSSLGASVDSIEIFRKAKTTVSSDPETPFELPSNQFAEVTV
jgi:hypothetical protein